MFTLFVQHVQDKSEIQTLHSQFRQALENACDAEIVVWIL